MNRCLELASKGSGKVSPNPLVGCVIVYQNKIIGEGFHQKYGGNHAEVNAINSVKNQELLAASILYVNLEPCSHFGKTPPCCELIVRKKIPKIVIGCADVSSKVNGSGVAFLKNHNLEVTQNVLNEKCKKLNIRFFHFQKTQIPYIILKWAQTKDGFIDKIREQNQKGINWITEKETQIIVHKWRSEEDAILVGRKTIENDNPELTVREYTGLNPLRIVIDSNLKLKLKHKVFNNDAPTVIVNNLLEKKNNQNFLPAYKIFVNSDKYHINYSNFNMPTLIMTGEDEVGSTPHMSEGISKEIKNSSLFIIKNAKHGATIEQANVVNEKINSFLY